MEHLGEAIREARKKKGLSLRSVAASAEISPSLLSQVETGKTNPSVGTLYALVNVLNVSIDELVSGNHPLEAGPARTEPTGSIVVTTGPPVQRREDNPTIVMENGVTWERLAVDGSGTIDSLITTYSPGGSSSVEGKLMRHSGIEYGLLLEGELTLRLDFETYVLRAGDSLCFDSLRPHLYENRTDSVARGLWFVVGRSRDGDSSPDGHGAMPAGGFPMNSAVDVLGLLGRMPVAATPTQQQ
ncbi:helix-turn-helix domain-containing protein [Leifsonia bigeumensis]|uniref:Helix-turn-helix domain-containing protein n=1 Tax=Leifsonella bigeumensis TaxID=433643 RepID=A0ABP7F9J5_9MICO